jgi:hypothetical protein
MTFGKDVTILLQSWLHVFRDPATAGWLVVLMSSLCLLLCIQYFLASIAPPLGALSRARRSLRGITFVSGGEQDAEREARLDKAVTAAAGRSGAGRRLLLAWRRRLQALHAGMPRGEEAIFRPALVLGPNPRWLGTAADSFIGLGLVFTFLGLVAALGAASETIATGEADAQSALLGLLGAASVKFFTSVAGVGGALILRLWQAFWISRVADASSQLSDEMDAHLLGAA